MLASLKYPIITAAAIFSACGGAVDPMPRTLDIPEEMEPVLKDFFTICPIAMSSMTEARIKAEELGWDYSEGTEHPSFFDSLEFQSEDGTDLLLNVMHTKDSAAIICQLSLSSYNLDDFPDFNRIDDAFDFDGQIEIVDETTYGSWTIGDYPNDVTLFSTSVQDEYAYAYIVMSRRVPKSHPLYNR